MGVTALWTAVHYRIPLLIVVANNRSFYNDEVHQERVARMRNRPVENKWIGQRINDPDIDLAGHGARAGRARLRPGQKASRTLPALSEGDRGRRRPAMSPWSMCGSSRAMRRHDGGHDSRAEIETVATAPIALAVAHSAGADGQRDGDAGRERHRQAFRRRRTARVTAVEDVSFDVRPGEFLSVIGPTGCGKSTLFNIIGGFVGGYEGTLLVDGRATVARRIPIGMVFQEESTFPWRTMLENVAFPLEVAGMPKRSARHARGISSAWSASTGFENRYPTETVGRHAPARRHRPHARLSSRRSS